MILVCLFETANITIAADN